MAGARAAERERCTHPAHAGRRRYGAAALVTAFLLLAAVPGCSWRPLYERPTPNPTSGGVENKLGRIQVEPVATPTTPDPLTGSRTAAYESRAAQLLQNELRSALNPYGPPSPPDYHLTVILTQTIRGTAVLGNGQSTREDLLLVAKYKLSDGKGALLLADRAQVVTSYDVLSEPFSDLSANRDATQRGIDQLAYIIETRLAVLLDH
jgi:hypothetical protein